MSDMYNGPRPVEDETPPGDEVVARLLQLAGHRPAIPAADAAIVKAAAHAEWQQLVWASRRRRLYLVRGVGGFLTAAAAVLLALNTNFTDRLRHTLTEPIAQVVATSGGVMDLEQKLWANHVVETDAASGTSTHRVALRLIDRASIRIDAGSRLLLESASVLELQHGTVYVDSNGSSLEIRTPLGILSNLGTRFEVHLEPEENSLRVRVREGKVGLDGSDGTTYTVEAGRQLVTDENGPQWGSIEGCGSTWDWVLAVRTPFEGTTVLDFLEWAAAESGWQLRFKGEAGALAQEADISTNKGDYEPETDLKVDVATWILGAELKHRFEDDCDLIVEPASP